MKKKLLLSIVMFCAATIANSQTCVPPTGQVDLDTNNVRARIMNAGDMWWDQALGAARYEIPKGSGHSAMFAGSVWLGGIDAGGKVHVAAQTYRQNGNDFWTGPVDTSASTDSTSCSTYDKLWKVTKTEINAHIINHSNPPTSISTWPAKGNTIGGIPITRDMAPFVDINLNGLYEPTLGDYPKINGDQAIWWIMNDVGNIHGESKARALGVEVQVMAYSYATNNVLNNTTFYNYNIKNMSDTTYNNFYIGFWADSDLGDATDDYIGCDTLRNAAIFYNSDALDVQYGTSIPVVAVVGLSTPHENGQAVKMKKMGYFKNDATSHGNPASGYQFYNYMLGNWKDSTAWGFNYAYPGSPCDSNQLSMVHPTPLVAADLRTIQSFGPMTFQPNECKNITAAVITTFNSTYPAPCFSNIQMSIDSVISLHATHASNILSCQNTTGIQSVGVNSIEVYPIPSSDKIIVENKSLLLTSYNIISLDGKVIQNGRMNTELIQIDLFSIPKGLYFLQLYSGRGNIVATKKIIKN